MINTALTKKEQKHYKSKINTSKIIQAFFREQKNKPPTSNQFYALCELTWGSKKRNISAICKLWEIKKDPNTIKEFSDLSKLGVPVNIINILKRGVGYVNFYAAYRNSSKKWIIKNIEKIAKICKQTQVLKRNQGILNIVKAIESLPTIPTKKGKGGHLPATNLITPVLACIDKRNQFPIINGRANHFLRKLSLINAPLSEKFLQMSNLIGKIGICDAFYLDELIFRTSFFRLASKIGERNVLIKSHGHSLNQKDDNDIEVIKKKGTLTFRRLHNTMTNRLVEIYRTKYLPLEGRDQKNKYDALIMNYNAHGRDLLIEVKSSIERSQLRLAVGQLLDYRRYLPNRTKTDLAVLLPKKPDLDSLNFLKEAKIYAIWFANTELKSLTSNSILTP
jgi:hypothetical protein